MSSRGSNWSIWDLHIHTPLSICNEYGGDNPEVWEKFILSLENLPKDVKVIGINDYYFIDGFEKVMDYKMNKGRLKNIEKIFPVLEFRIDTFASASETQFQKVNYHILFNIDDMNWKKEVYKIKKEFIELIRLSKLPEHQTKILSKENFIEVAGSLKDGFNNIVPNTEQVIEYVNSETWRDRTFIFIGYKEWSNLDKKQQLKPFKENIFEKADAFFTASKTDNIENKERVIQQFGNKAIIHSNDIHNFNLFNENYYCFTWIKAEHTFEGLKQILFEQNERLKIQQSNPEYDEQKDLIIDTIKIRNSNGWFGEEELKLNRGLVSIIGEKGAGKTALLDIIAVSNDEGIYEQDIKNPYSFYNRAKKIIEGTEVYVKNYGNDEFNKYTISAKNISDKSNIFGKVRYLSLKELESYCDDKEKLQSFIKNIIYSKAPEAEEYDRDSKEIVKKITSINEKIVELENSIKPYGEILKQLEEKKSELQLKINNEPKVKTSFTSQQIQEYKDLLVTKQELIASIEKKNLDKNKILYINSWISTRIIELNRELNQEINEKLNGLSEEVKAELSSISLSVIINNNDIIHNKLNIIQKEIYDLDTTIKLLDKKITPLEELNKNYYNENKIIKKWIEDKKKLENEIEKLNLDLKAMNEVRESIVEYEKRREELIEKLLRNKIEQKNKYYKLKDLLESDTNINFDVDIVFDEEKLYDEENLKINHNMGNSIEIIRNNFKKLYIDKVNNLSEESIENIIKFFKELNEDELIKKIFGDNRNKNNLLKKSYGISEIYNLLYGDYYSVNYSIKFKGRALQSLSPGQKGLVLMKIFLKLDDSNKPLLIDQPEDNLDNKSVYKDLVEDLKAVKKKRQIIIATHNPNLVINTDSEQVIVAKYEESKDNKEPRITYISGALEDRKIKESVCDILEGGDIAFMKREKRYNL